MKTVSKITLSLALMLGLGIGSSYAQSATSPASLEIKTALTIALETGTEIDFGVLSATTPGIVRLDPNAAANNTNTGAATKVAQFNVTGGQGAGVVFTFDPTVTLTATAGAALTAGPGSTALTMTMTPLVVGDDALADRSTAAALTTTAVNLSSAATGLYYVWVGGTVPQLTGATTGEYAGTFNIAVDYN